MLSWLINSYSIQANYEAKIAEQVAAIASLTANLSSAKDALEQAKADAAKAKSEADKKEADKKEAPKEEEKKVEEKKKEK